MHTDCDLGHYIVHYDQATSKHYSDMGCPVAQSKLPILAQTMSLLILPSTKTRVSVNRIETFLGEDEVPEQVSMLKRAQDDPSKFSSDALGFRDASFKWNAVTERSKLPKNDSPHNSPDADTANGAPERKFELHDLNVIFPEGKLTVVTGPTASGKTAIIVRHWTRLTHPLLTKRSIPFCSL